MAYRNTRTFNPSKMGKRAGWCLQNCREGFGITTGMRPSAKADWEQNVQHKDKNFPKGVWVPVYWDTSSKYEHVTVTNGDGYHYSDGVRVKMWTTTPCLGWGELCDGRRVVEKVAEQSPSAPAVSVPSRSSTAIAGELPSRGYWKQGDKGDFIGKVTAFLRKNYSLYTSANALGPVYGPYAVASIKEFQKRTDLKSDGYIGPLTIAELKKRGLKV